MADFASFVDQWTKETEGRMLAVFKRAVELLAEELAKAQGNGGRTPKLTGNLIRSILAQIGAMPSQGGPGAQFGGSDVGLVVAGAVLGDSISIGFQANYSRRLNYGFVGQDSAGRTYNQSGAYFVEAAAAKWPEFVNAAAAEVRGQA